MITHIHNDPPESEKSTNRQVDQIQGALDLPELSARFPNCTGRVL